jgi:hypothetical protein
MSNFLNQHRAIGVLLDRYVRANYRRGRVTLNGFINYLKTHRDVKVQFKSYGRHCLRKALSHSLRSGAYSGFTMSKGEGIVRERGYRKQTHRSEFVPTLRQLQRLGIN